MNDPGNVKDAFRKLVAQDEELEGHRTAVARRVATRWNSDLDCLMSYMHFKDIITTLTSKSGLRLKKYELTSDQWLLAEDVKEVLLVRHLFEFLCSIS